MRYMVLIKPDLAKAPEGGPSAELMEAMGALLAEMTKAGVLIDTGGLAPVQESSVLRLSGGEVTPVDGPFTEAKELIGGYALLQTKTQDEAVEWGKRFLLIHGDAWEMDLEVREVQEAE